MSKSIYCVGTLGYPKNEIGSGEVAMVIPPVFTGYKMPVRECKGCGANSIDAVCEYCGRAK